MKKLFFDDRQLRTQPKQYMVHGESSIRSRPEPAENLIAALKPQGLAVTGVPDQGMEPDPEGAYGGLCGVF